MVGMLFPAWSLFFAEGPCCLLIIHLEMEGPWDTSDTRGVQLDETRERQGKGGKSANSVCAWNLRCMLKGFKPRTLNTEIPELQSRTAAEVPRGYGQEPVWKKVMQRKQPHEERWKVALE